MVRLFVMRWHLIERVFDQRAVARESLQQPRRVVISHHRDFIRRLQARDRVTGRAMHIAAERIETTAPIDQQEHRERQTVLTKVRDLLFGSVFV